MSEQHKKEAGLRKKRELTIVIIATLVILLVASVYIISYFRDAAKSEAEREQFAKDFSTAAKEHNDAADKIRSTVNDELVGNYMLMGEANVTDPSRAYSVIKLLPDGTVLANAFDGSIANGWWRSQKSDGDNVDSVELVAVLFPEDKEPTMYGVWNNSLFEWGSAYLGHVEYAPSFESTFISAYDTGVMTIDISKDGSAYAEFVDTNEASENKGLKYVYAGSYTVENEHIIITLDDAATRFLMFDYNMEGSETDSGIAPIFYEKME